MSGRLAFLRTPKPSSLPRTTLRLGPSVSALDSRCGSTAWRSHSCTTSGGESGADSVEQNEGGCVVMWSVSPWAWCVDSWSRTTFEEGGVVPSIVGERVTKFMAEAAFTVDGADGQGALYWKGTHVGFVYYEDGDYWKFYPSGKGGLFGDELNDLALLLSELQERTDSESRAKTLCVKRVHSFERANSVGAELYVCIDCGEPGFWVPGVEREKAVMSRDEALSLLSSAAGLA